MDGGCRYGKETLFNGGGFGVLGDRPRFSIAVENISTSLSWKERDRPWFPSGCPSPALLELG